MVTGVAQVTNNAGRESQGRAAAEPHKGPCLYKDKWPRSGGHGVPGRASSDPARVSEAREVRRKARKLALPPRIVPAHVKHCHSAGARDWWIYVWKKNDPGRKTRVPYQCNSWRCEHCAEHEASVTYARMRDACLGLTADGFVYFVLTIDREGTFSGRKWKDAREAYAELSRMTRNFLKRLRRWMKHEDWRVLKNEWVAVVEAHRTGWPHLNLMVYAPELAEYLARERAERERQGMMWPATVHLTNEIANMATETGWGLVSSAERVESVGKMHGYLTKLCGFGDKANAEITKLTQLPLNAPERFRRLRSGKGFLPPRHSNPDVTGTMVRRTIDTDGHPLVLPLHNVKPHAMQEVARACVQEEEIVIDELTARAWNRLLVRAGKPWAQVLTPFVSRWQTTPGAPRGPPVMRDAG